ncbi:MAG: hypothetical protein R2832_15030 [Rhodothermales bacterium]
MSGPWSQSRHPDGQDCDVDGTDVRLGSGSSTGFSLAVAVGPDGKVYVGGAFDEIRGVPAKVSPHGMAVSWSAGAAASTT